MARFYLNGQPCNFPLSPLEATCNQVGSLQHLSALEGMQMPRGMRIGCSPASL